MIGSSIDAATAVLSKSGPAAGLALISMAVAADPANVVQVSDWLEAKPSIIQGAVFGGVIFLLIGEGTRWMRLCRAAASSLFAYMGSGGLIEIGFSALVATPATERLFAMLCGIVGVILAETLIKFFGAVRDRSPEIANDAVTKYAGGHDDKK